MRPAKMLARGTPAPGETTSISAEEMHQGIASFLGGIDEPVLCDSLVAYEFLDNNLAAHWSLARVLSLSDHHALLQRWRAENGSNADILETLKQEKELKEEEVRNCRRSLLQQREELATVRRDTEAEVARAKDKIEDARRLLEEVEEVRLHEAFSSRLPSAGLCLALEASIAILNQESMEDVVMGWEDLRAVVRHPDFITRLLEYYPTVENSMDEHQDIINRYQPRLLKLQEQVRLSPRRIVSANSVSLESVFCDWALAQLGFIIVYPEIKKSQARAKEISEAINNNIRTMKLLETQISQIIEQQHLYKEGNNVVNCNKADSDACLSFAEASDIAPITVPRSSITAAIPGKGSGTVIVGKEEAKRLTSRTAMHRPLIYAALGSALEERARLEAKNTDKTKLIQELQQEKDNVYSQNNDLAKQFKNLEEELHKLQKELEQQKTLAKKQEDYHKQQIENKIKNQQEMSRQLQQSKEQVKQLQQQDKKRDKENHGYKTQLEKMEEQMEEINNKNKTLKKLIEQKKQEIIEVYEHAKDLQLQLEEMHAEIEQLRAENEELRGEHEEKTRGLQEVSEQAEDLQRQLEELRAENEELRAENEDKTRGLQEVSEQAEDLQRQLEELRAENEQLRAEDEHKTRGLQEVSEQAEDLQRQLEELRAENEQLRAENEELRGEHEHKTRGLQEVSEQAEDLQRQLEELRAENEQLRSVCSVGDRGLSSVGKVLSRHRCLLGVFGFGEVLRSNEEALCRAVNIDVASAVGLPVSDIHGVEFGPEASYCDVDVEHDPLLSEDEIDRRLRRCPFLKAKSLLGPAANCEDGADARAEVLRQLEDSGADPLLSLIAEEFISRLVFEQSAISSLLEGALEGFRCLDALHQRRESDLLDELDERATEYTDMLEKSEEMVQLLEEARQAECSARSELFNREEALLELQRRRDDDLRELEAVTHAHRNLLHAIRQPREGMTDDNAEESFSEAERVQGIERHAVQLESENIALREEMAQRAVAHREAMEGLNNKISKLMEELEAKGMEYTETLGKLEEFVGLLEAARAAEKSALMALEKREQELFELQAAHDEEMRELESAMKGLDGGALPPQGGAADFPAAEMQANTAVADVDKNAVRTMRQQLERLKREKEALVMELEVKGRQHEDALNVLNRNIGELMGELDSRIRGCQVSATSAKELLHEIALLRSAEEENEEEYNEGD